MARRQFVQLRLCVRPKCSTDFINLDEAQPYFTLNYLRPLVDLDVVPIHVTRRSGEDGMLKHGPLRSFQVGHQRDQQAHGVALCFR